MSKVSRNVVNREPNEAATEGERNLWMVDFIMDFMGFFCYFHNKIHNKSTYKIIKNNKCRNDPKNPKIKKINEKKLGVFGSLYTPSSHHIPFQPFPLRSSGLLTPFQLLPSLWCERECKVTRGTDERSQRDDGSRKEGYRGTTAAEGKRVSEWLTREPRKIAVRRLFPRAFLPCLTSPPYTRLGTTRDGWTEEWRGVCKERGARMTRMETATGRRLMTEEPR